MSKFSCRFVDGWMKKLYNLQFSKTLVTHPTINRISMKILKIYPPPDSTLSSYPLHKVYKLYFFHSFRAQKLQHNNYFWLLLKGKKT